MAEIVAEPTLFGIAMSLSPRVAVIGAPLDLSPGCRCGGGNGPAAIRELSRALESYSPTLDRDLEAARVCDLGDLELADDLESAVEQIERAVAEQLDLGRVPVLLGGEHTISVGAIRALLLRHPGLLLVDVDAHCDLHSRAEGGMLSRKTWISDSGIPLDRVFQVGVRSFPRELPARAGYTSRELALPRELVESRPVYLSVDIDVLDPAAAPGVLCPEPGGPRFDELLAFVHSLTGFDLVGFDIVEVAPDTDPAGLAALSAAKILRELLLLLV